MKAIFMILCLLIPVGLGAAPLFSKAHSVITVEQKLSRLPQDGKRHLKAVLYTDLGSLHYTAGQFAQAITAFETALEHKTNRVLRKHIYVYLGKSYESSGRLDKAIEAYQHAVQYDPRNWKRHRDLGWLLEQVKVYDQAAASYAKALKYNNREMSVYFDQGRVWRKYGRYERAEKFLKQAKDHGAAGEDLDRELALVYENQGRFVEATTRYIRTVSPASSFQDWARMLYLARQANDQFLIEQSLEQMRLKPEAEQSLAFYEEVVELYTDSPARVLTLELHDPTLKNLVTSMAAESSNK